MLCVLSENTTEREVRWRFDLWRDNGLKERSYTPAAVSICTKAWPLSSHTRPRFDLRGKKHQLLRRPLLWLHPPRPVYGFDQQQAHQRDHTDRALIRSVQYLN